MYTRKFSAIFTAVAILSSANSVFAGTSTAPLVVTATVVPSCIISTMPVAFGSYDPTNSAATTKNGQVKITCEKDAVPIITLSYGQNSSGDTSRAMKFGNATLSYQLFQPTDNNPGTSCSVSGNETTIWSSDIATGFAVSTVAVAGEQTFNICGKIPAGQYVTPGTYTDTVIASVNF